MEKVWRTLVLIALVAFVAIGTAGCRKKTDGNGNGGVILLDEGIQLTPNEVPIEDFYPPANAEVYKMIHFDYDKSDIREDARPILEGIAMDLKANTSIYLLVEGHCDERGTNEYNLALGERRALSTREYLAKLGVEARRIVTISYGEEVPLDTGDNEAAWSVNRRAEFKTYDSAEVVE